jgi:hypothetical protein
VSRVVGEVEAERQLRGRVEQGGVGAFYMVLCEYGGVARRSLSRSFGQPARSLSANKYRVRYNFIFAFKSRLTIIYSNDIKSILSCATYAMLFKKNSANDVFLSRFGEEYKFCSFLAVDFGIPGRIDSYAY